MPTPTYTPLANITLGSSAASVTFSSISQAYRDLILVVNGTKSATSYQNIQVNSDTGGNYNQIKMFGYVGGIGSNSGSNETKFSFGYAEANQQMMFRFNFQDYSATDKHKTTLGLITEFETNLAILAHSGRWASTSAITSIKVACDSGNYNSGTTFALYGIAA